MDVAASEFYTGKEDNRYDLDFKSKDNDGSQKITAAALTDMYAVSSRHIVHPCILGQGGLEILTEFIDRIGLRIFLSRVLRIRLIRMTGPRTLTCKPRLVLELFLWRSPNLRFLISWAVKSKLLEMICW